MKISFKIFTFKIILGVFCLFGTSSIFAQDLFKECEATYEQIFSYHGYDIDRKKEILTKAKQYLEKCRNVKGQEELKAYIEKQIPNIQKNIDEAIWQRDIIDVFNKSVVTKNWDITFDKGETILEKNPDFLDVPIILASIGYENAGLNPPVDKYNDDTIKMAKMALALLSAGKPSITTDYGAFKYRYKTKACPNGRTNAKAWMNYIIGYIMYYRQSLKTEAIPYLEQSVNIGCETETFYETYRILGESYLEESQKSNEKKKVFLIKSLNAYQKAYEIAATNSKVSQSYKERLREKVKNLLELVKQEK